MTEAEKAELIRAAVRKMMAEEEKADPGKFDRYPYVSRRPIISFEEFMDRWNAKIALGWWTIAIFGFMIALGLFLGHLPNN